MSYRKKPVVKVNKITGKVVATYESAYEAAKENPAMPYYTICGMCQRNTLGYQTYVYRFADKYKPNESFEGHRVNVPIELERNGKYIYAANKTIAANLLNCTRENVLLAIKEDRPIKGVRVRGLRYMGDICKDAHMETIY